MKSVSVQHMTELWTRTAADRAAVARGCWFDHAAAWRARKFFKRFLRHSKGSEFAGKPFALLRYQWREIVGPLFGWKRADGTRRFRRGYISVAKKNGKSALGSAIAIYMLVADGEPGAEVYCVANDREQAGIVYSEAANMVDASPALKSILKVNRSIKHIAYKRQQAWFKALSSEASTKDGPNAHCLLFDELHGQKNRDLWDKLAYAGANRRQPLMLAMTTAGFDRHSICWEQCDYARKILAGIIEDDAFFAYVAEAADEDDWTSPEVWRKANPSMGVTVREDEMAEACREAQNSPSKENAFRRFRLNQWTEQDVRWLDMAKWDACDGAVDLDDLHGRPCFAGLDLASTTDIAALSLLFPPQEEGELVKVRPFFFVPGEAVESRARRDRVPYAHWIKDGLIEATEGDTIDYAVIRRHINELNQLVQIKHIACDRWNATQICTELTGDGFDVVGFGQGFASMNYPTKELERLILEGQLAHGGNPVLRWMASNVATEMDAAGNLKPSKKKSTEKIDGIVATIMAIGLMALEPKTEEPRLIVL